MDCIYFYFWGVLYAYNSYPTLLNGQSFPLINPYILVNKQSNRAEHIKLQHREVYIYYTFLDHTKVGDALIKVVYYLLGNVYLDVENVGEKKKKKKGKPY